MLPMKRCMNMMWVGRIGFRRSCIPACSGVRLAFLLLHRVHAVTRFSQVSPPPCDFGITWSIVSPSVRPQYWHWLPSRRRIFRRVSMIFLYGTAIKTINRTTDGIGNSAETERMNWSGYAATISALPAKMRIIAFLTSQILIGS